MKRLIFFAAALLLFPGAGVAQVENPLLGNHPMRVPVFSNTPKGYTGTPYIDDAFKEGRIMDDKGREQEVWLRYHAVEGIVEIKLEPSDPEVLVLPKLNSITYMIEGYPFELETFWTEDGEKLEGYFTKYYESENIKLLGWQEPDVIEPQKARSGYEKAKPAHLTVGQQYFLSLDKGRLEEVKLKPRSFRKAFEDSRVMEGYFSEQKVKDLEQALEAVRFYDKNS